MTDARPRLAMLIRRLEEVRRQAGIAHDDPYAIVLDAQRDVLIYVEESAYQRELKAELRERSLDTTLARFLCDLNRHLRPASDLVRLLRRMSYALGVLLVAGTIVTLRNSGGATPACQPPAGMTAPGQAGE